MASKTKARWGGVLAGAVLVLWGAGHAALAQESASTATRAEDFWLPKSRVGVSVIAGGGVGDFSNETVSRATGVGGSWNVRVTSGTRLPFAWELAYLGGANDVTGPGIGDNDFMINNTFESNLRFNLPRRVGPSMLLEPFVTAGMGWSRYNLVKSAPGPERMAAQDDQLVVPLSLGMAFGFHGFTAEARGSYRFAFDDEMFRDRDMSTWNVSMGIGAEF